MLQVNQTMKWKVSVLIYWVKVMSIGQRQQNALFIIYYAENNSTDQKYRVAVILMIKLQSNTTLVNVIGYMYQRRIRMTMSSKNFMRTLIKLDIISTSPPEVTTLTKSLSIKKAPRQDQIPNIILKNANKKLLVYIWQHYSTPL